LIRGKWWKAVENGGKRWALRRRLLRRSYGGQIRHRLTPAGQKDGLTEDRKGNEDGRTKLRIRSQSRLADGAGVIGIYLPLELIGFEEKIQLCLTLFNFVSWGFYFDFTLCEPWFHFD
jgi:hypothetical protein